MNPIARSRWIIIILAVIFLMDFVLFWNLRKDRQDQDEASTPLSVSVIKPTRQTLAQEMVFSSALNTERTITILPRVSGMLLEVLVEEGDRVQENQILAQIDAEPFLLEFQAAEASWLLAESSLKRTERLFESSGASQQQLDEAQAARDSAFAQMEMARMRLEYAQIQSPLSGTVMARYGDEGDMASSQTPLFLIGSTNQLEVVAHVPQKYWDVFQQKSYRDVRVWRENHQEQTALARVLRMSPGIQPTDGTFSVVCSLPEGTPEAWPIGGSVYVGFSFGVDEPLWTLPAEALTSKGLVWRYNTTDGTVQPVELPSIETDGSHVAIPEEWAQDQFILNGHHRLREGQAVTAFEVEA